MESSTETVESVIVKKQTITIPRWFDRHLHIRDGAMMETVLPCTLKQQATGAIIMPNLDDPISSIEKAKAYLGRIEGVLRKGLPLGSDFRPCMTLYLTDSITPEEVVRGFEEGVWKAVKLYMADQKGQGGTTGSAHGVKNLIGRYRVFEAMEKYKIPLLGHFEAVEDGIDEFDREAVSVYRDAEPILSKFPNLPMVLEHITTAEAADFVAFMAPSLGYKNVYATVTAHHLMINRNELFRGGMNPIHWCKPVAKREEHRLKVRNYVTSGNRHFGAGTDSAPHDISAKTRCCGCAAGIFTAPNAVELYTTVFDEDNALQHLGSFLSENFLHIYGTNVSSETMTINRENLFVPREINGIPVFKGGFELLWKLARKNP